MANVRVGLSGYAYPEWQGEGRLYPAGTKRREYLVRYAERYSTLEAVGTWRQMPTEATVGRWIAETPDDFKVCPKMHADVTHVARLKPSGLPKLRQFVEALAPLEEAGKLDPILIQLPPNLKRDDELLGTFFAAVPATLPWAVEFRHESWQTPEVEAILRERNVAWVAVDEEGGEATLRDSADQVYVRLRKLAYSDDELRTWTERLHPLAAKGKSVRVFVRHKDVEAPWLYADRLLELFANLERTRSKLTLPKS